MKNDTKVNRTDERLRELLRAENRPADPHRLDAMRRIVLAHVPEETRESPFAWLGRWKVGAGAAAFSAALLAGVVFWRSLPQGQGSLEPVYALAEEEKQIDRMIVLLASVTSDDTGSVPIFDPEAYDLGTDPLMEDDDWGYSFWAL